MPSCLLMMTERVKITRTKTIFFTVHFYCNDASAASIFNRMAMDKHRGKCIIIALFSHLLLPSVTYGDAKISSFTFD